MGKYSSSGKVRKVDSPQRRPASRSRGQFPRGERRSTYRYRPGDSKLGIPAIRDPSPTQPQGIDTEAPTVHVPSVHVEPRPIHIPAPELKRIVPATRPAAHQNTPEPEPDQMCHFELPALRRTFFGKIYHQLPKPLTWLLKPLTWILKEYKIPKNN